MTPSSYAAAIAGASWSMRHPSRPDQSAAIAAAHALGAADRLAGTERAPGDAVLTAGDHSGHPRTTRHPGTYGHCPLDDVRALILEAYSSSRWGVGR